MSPQMIRSNELGKDSSILLKSLPEYLYRLNLKGLSKMISLPEISTLHETQISGKFNDSFFVRHICFTAMREPPCRFVSLFAPLSDLYLAVVQMIRLESVRNTDYTIVGRDNGCREFSSIVKTYKTSQI